MSPLYPPSLPVLTSILILLEATVFFFGTEINTNRAKKIGNSSFYFEILFVKKVSSHSYWLLIMTLRSCF